MRTRITVCALLLAACLTSAAFAAPQKMNFQGKLTDTAGNPISTSVSMTFSIYDSLTATAPLWTETQTVAVANGIYNVLLGKVNPINTELTETKALWLGVKVGADAKMSPRVELTPGMYDLIMLNTITVKNGNIGIGTTTPSAKLDVAGIANSKAMHIGINNESIYWKDQILIESSLNSPYGIAFNGQGHHRGGIYAENTGGTDDSKGTITIWARSDTPGAGRVNIKGVLYVNGQDIAEPFDMIDLDVVELGDVVVMDPANPKHLKKSVNAYDHKVAGIVSSAEQAGYVAGSRSDGTSDKPVALTGRVLCKVSAENGKIEVGDLLTTSDTPGYAMKATDRDKAFGAVLGKALEPFDGETGTILVLVALQ